MKRWPRRRLLVPVTIGLVLGLSGGALAAFAATTTDGPNRFIAAADWEAPHVTRTVIAKTVGYLAGSIRQGGQFYVYAQIDDGGNPPAGVGTVTADVSAISTGGGAVAMVAGAFSEQGVPYNYRSATRTAINPMANGTRTYSFTMSDVAVPVHSQTQTGFPVDHRQHGTGSRQLHVDEPAGRRRRTRRARRQHHVHVEHADRPRVAHPRLGRWVTDHRDGPDQERWQQRSDPDPWSPAGNLNFGHVSLQQNYVPATRDFTGSTITMLGNSVTIVLGTPSGTVNTVTVATPTTWQASNGAYDAAGNACSTATITGSGSPRIDF